MAEKEKEKKGGALTIFTKEYKYEGIILLVLSLIALILGTMVLLGSSETTSSSGLVINEDVFLIGDYPEAFAWILIILGAVSLILAAWPYFKPSIDEVKRVTWQSRGQLFKNTATVFAFTIILAIFFILSDWIFGYAVEFFQWLALQL